MILTIQGTVLGSAFFIVGLLVMVFGVLTIKRRMIIKNTPTEKVSSASTGRTELKGVARKLHNLINKPFSPGDAILADWEIQEYDYDDDGSNWDQVDSGRECVNFYLEDDSGKIEVEPKTDSTWELKDNVQIFDHGESPNENIKDFCTKNDITLDTSEKRRYKMSCLEPNENVYVFGGNVDKDLNGNIKNDSDTILRTKIKEDPSSEYFIISDKSEHNLSSDLIRRAIFLLIFGLVFSTGGLAVLLNIYI